MWNILKVNSSSGVFIVNFEHISHFALVHFFVNFEHVNAGCICHLNISRISNTQSLNFSTFEIFDSTSWRPTKRNDTFVKTCSQHFMHDSKTFIPLVALVTFFNLISCAAFFFCSQRVRCVIQSFGVITVTPSVLSTSY